MEKIDRLVSENRNSRYTLEMMEETERRREEEKRAEKERREREHQMILDTVREETEIRVRKEYEQEIVEKERRERERRETEIPVTEYEDQCGERRGSGVKHFVTQYKYIILALVVGAVIVLIIVLAVKLSS